MDEAGSADLQSLRVLVFAKFFPKPGENPDAFWSFTRIRAVAEAGSTVEVICPVAYLPHRSPTRGNGFHFPDRSDDAHSHDWGGGITAHYPEGFFYVGRGVGWKLWWKQPDLMNAIGWRSVWPSIEIIVRRFQPEVMWGIGSWVCGDPIRRTQEVHAIPAIITEHDLVEMQTSGESQVRKRFYTKVYRNVSASVPSSHRMGEALASNVRVRRIEVAPNGSVAPPPEVSIIPKLRPDSEAPRFVSASWFYVRKAVPMLIRAFDEVRRVLPKARLKIIGSGRTFAECQTLVRTLGLQEAITLTGSLPVPELLREFRQADIFVLAAYQEALGNVFMEAMSVGTPVIASDDGGVCEFITDGVHGRFFSARDQASLVAVMREMTANPERLIQMSQACERLTSNWRWSHWGQRVRELLVEVAREGIPTDLTRTALDGEA
jgi:glycosyltransferase involved in cell wall biosynthesis